jgi:uncharacterized protein (DUF169 family)
VDIAVRDNFNRLWAKYFGYVELPIVFYYSKTPDREGTVKPGSVSRCLIGALNEVRKGRTLCFDKDAVSCPGGQKYLGFKSEDAMPNFEYFLSCGIKGKVEGERYKKTPELVREYMKNAPSVTAPAPYIIFKRWDLLDEKDTPEIAVFYATSDVLSGLFTLANYDQVDPNGVFTPFGSGCSSIVQYPYLEKNAERPRGVIGLFDISARPFVPENTLTFSVPMKKLESMIANMEESFLVTRSWDTVKKRIVGGEKP